MKSKAAAGRCKATTDPNNYTVGKTTTKIIKDIGVGVAGIAFHHTRGYVMMSFGDSDSNPKTVAMKYIVGIFDCIASSKAGIDLKEIKNKGLADG